MKKTLHYLVICLLFIVLAALSSCIKEVDDVEVTEVQDVQLSVSEQILNDHFNTEGKIKKEITLIDSGGKNEIILAMYSNDEELLNYNFENTKYSLVIFKTTDEVIPEDDSIFDLAVSDDDTCKNNVLTEVIYEKLENDVTGYGIHVERKASKSTKGFYSESFNNAKWRKFLGVRHANWGNPIYVRMVYKSKWYSKWKLCMDWTQLYNGLGAYVNFTSYKKGVQILRSQEDVNYTIVVKESGW